ASYSGLAHLRVGQPEADVVVLQGAVADQDRVPQRALPKQMRFVFARSEIDRGELFRGDLAVHRHCEGDGNEWTFRRDVLPHVLVVTRRPERFGTCGSTSLRTRLTLPAR